MARGGDLPAFFHHVHPTYGVPGRAVLAVGGIAMLIAATGTLRGVASAASFTILIYYGIANFCALRMPREVKLYPDFVPRFGLVACGVLALSLTTETIVTGMLVLIVGFALRSGVAAQRGR